jgi:hypothetical protein
LGATSVVADGEKEADIEEEEVAEEEVEEEL